LEGVVEDSSAEVNHPFLNSIPEQFMGALQHLKLSEAFFSKHDTA